MEALVARMDRLAPANQSLLPVACAQERLPDGTLIWTVDIHVLIPAVVEYDLSAQGATLAEALRRTYLGLNNEQALRRNALISSVGTPPEA